MSLKYGSIILVPFPFTDLTNKKTRPALLLSNPNGVDLILAFITSVNYEPIEPMHYSLSRSLPFFDQTGLKVNSIIKCDKLASLSKSIIIGRLGDLPEYIMKTEINKRLKMALNIE